MMRGRGSVRGRGRGSARAPDPNTRKRALFTKLIHDGVDMNRKYQAIRFLEGMDTFMSKSELLSIMLDDRKHGQRRIQEIVSFLDSVEDAEDLAVKIMEYGTNEEMSRPLYRGLRDRYLNMVYRVPMLLEFLDRDDIIPDMATSSANTVCLFLLCVAKAIGEARASKTVTSIATKLRDRGDIDDSDTLCVVLVLDRPKASRHRIRKQEMGEAVCWVTDNVPPGGRHDNDHENYRDVNVVPSPDELRCRTRPYLPLSGGQNAFVQDPVARLLDSNFRLLREDSVSSMREGISDPKWPWFNARVVDLDLKGSNSLSFIVQVDPPERKIADWDRAKVLLHGSIFALLDGNSRLVRTGTITTRQMESLKNPLGPSFGVEFNGSDDFDDAVREMARNRTVNDQYADALLTGNHRRSQRFLQCMTTYKLVEISKSFFAYKSVLKALQQMDQIPFADELISFSPGPSPNYFPEHIVFPKDEKFRSYRCNLATLSATDISNGTSLDLSQAEAVRHALTSRVSLIQGPPGTGKTFIGGLIAQLVRANTDETILCVCYTNHALDQFLEHMISFGETRMVRVGGRTKSDQIGKYQLGSLATSKVQHDETTSSRIRQVDAQMHKLREQITEVIELLQQPVLWHSPDGGIAGTLEYMYPREYDFVRLPYREAEQGFRVVGRGGKKLSPDFLWKTWSDGKDFPAFLLGFLEDFPKDMEEFWRMPGPQRIDFIARVEREVFEPTRSHLHELVKEFRELQEERNLLNQEKYLQILNDARIIGATTSGAARYRELLTEVSPSVIIVEEAGEVLEAHILTSLSPDSKSLVMIGDHLQLRPKVETHNLSKVSGGGYDLDVSLFERLVLGGLPSATLAVQHRMRPSISSIIRSQTYPELLDHESVHGFPNVRGMSENLVFIDHDHPEDGEMTGADLRSTTTKSNQHEAEICVEIVRYLLLQGYAKDQIVILTPYLGQLLRLTKELKYLKDVEAYVSDQDLDKFEGDEYDDLVKERMTERAGCIRVSTVDNYQGEESDLVVGCIVRSNRKGAIGFLKEPQRVNVFLSRARHGMILVGNSKTLVAADGKKTWTPILEMLGEKGRILKGLPTVCQIHPDDPPILLSSRHEFRKHRPNGGCDRPCGFRLACGHACPMMCHPVDRNHVNAQKSCCQPCKRVPEKCQHGHLCTKLCKDDCGPCVHNVGPKLLPCGHVAASIGCHNARNEEALQEYARKCNREVTFTFETCGHTAQTSCGNANLSDPICPCQCGGMMDCGHPCMNRCGTCNEGHACKEKCERTLFCGHVCGSRCHLPEGCPPCSKSSCDARCNHSICPRSCSEPCASCVEQCDWVCKHQGQCSLVCGAPCDRLPCNERCNKILECGHRCPSVCGETCPSSSYCVKCGSDWVRSKVVDMILFERYEEHDLDSDPVLVLPCKHFFSMSTLDGHIGIDQVYNKAQGDEFVSTLPLMDSGVNEKSKQCPECRAPIHSIQRYSRLTKFSSLRALERKHIVKVEEALKGFSSTEPSKRHIGMLLKVKNTILASPMKLVFDACGGNSKPEVPAPPVLPLIHCLELLGQTYASKAKAVSDSNIEKSAKAFEDAIAVADASGSLRSGGSLRNSMARSLGRWVESLPELKSKLRQHLKFVQTMDPNIAGELLREAKELEDLIQKNNIAAVVRAMNVISGYDYGGGANSHWYQCPNGHPYFIGECGGAMQTSRCIECGSEVGGQSHQLQQDNQLWAGLQEAMQG